MKLSEQINRMKTLAGVLREFNEKSLHLPNGVLDRLKDQYQVKQQFDGTYGVAYLTGQGTVLKITSDEREATLAKKLVGKSFKHHAAVYSVNKINGYYGYVYWVIHLEYLTPLATEEKEVWEIVHYLDEYFSPKGMWVKKFSGTREQVLDTLRSDTTGWNPGLTYALQHKLGQDNAAVLRLYDAYTAILNEMKRYKVTDLHRENVGRKQDGTIAAFDLRQ